MYTMTDLDIFLRDVGPTMEQVGICLGLVIIEKILQNYHPRKRETCKTM